MIPLWKKLSDWWNSDFNKKPSISIMTIQELQDEYKQLYNQICASDGHSPLDLHRMQVIELELQSRGWWISKGVGCEFIKNKEV